MDVRHSDRKLARIELEARYSGGFGADIVKAYRKRMQLIHAAIDERAFYALKSLHYERLRGDRSHQRSMRLNDQFRLILEMEMGSTGNTAVIVSIEDYH